jgi:c-di-GMP-binding flagellar brake protein YcgR
LRLGVLARENPSSEKNIFPQRRKDAKVKIPKKEATFVFEQGE